MSVFLNIFYKEPIYKDLWSLSDGNVRNLTSRPANAKKLFLHGLLHCFYYMHKNCRWWVVVDDGGYILAGGGRWWVVV